MHRGCGVGRRGLLLGSLLLGDLLDRTSKTAGNAIDANSDVAGEAVDEAGDLAEKLILGGQLGDSVDLLGGNRLTVGDTALDLENTLGLLGELLEGLSGSSACLTVRPL